MGQPRRRRSVRPRDERILLLACQGLACAVLCPLGIVASVRLGWPMLLVFWGVAGAVCVFLKLILGPWE